MSCEPKIWGDTLCRLQEEIPDFAYATWIAPLAVKTSSERIVLGCPNSFHRDRVRIQYRDLLERSLAEAFAAHGQPQHCTIEFVMMSEFAQQPGCLIGIESPARREAEVVSRPVMRQVAARDTALEATAGPGGSDRLASGSHRSAQGAPVSSTAAVELAFDPGAKSAAASRTTQLKPVPSCHAAGKRQSALRASLDSEIRSPTGAQSRRSQQAAALRARPPQPELPFSFESFVVGPCNALAREAALALARARQRDLRLLYLGGESGMGKTHLARATAAEARRHGSLVAPPGPLSAREERGAKGKGGSVVYSCAEQFTSEFVSAMRSGHSEDFKRRYRGRIGLLVVEDIQFFSGRAKTQLELFHTLQHVLDTGGRVLLTGDKTPQQLTGLDERMRAQVRRGFVAELEPPDAIVRRHILRSKAAAGGVRLPADCLDLLVEASQGSVRDIESMLIQVVTTSSLLGRAIDLDLTRDAIELKSSTNPKASPRTLAVSEIVGIVAAFFGKRPEALAVRSRRRDVLIPRQLAMYLAHRFTDASYAEIGRSLGRDHPAVRNAIQRIERQVLENAPIRYQLEALSERIDQTLDDRTPKERAD
jgi:chromosomal replication initiator protein